MINAALPTAIAMILIHAMILMALVDLFDLKYRQAKRRFKFLVVYWLPVTGYRFPVTSIALHFRRSIFFFLPANLL